MVQDEDKGSNPVVPDLSVVETAYRSYLLNTRHSLDSTKRIFLFLFLLIF